MNNSEPTNGKRSRHSHLNRHSRSPRVRQGSAIFAVIVCLLVVSSILLGMVTSGIRDRGQTRTELQLQQTILLLEAGIEKVATMPTSKISELPDDETMQFKELAGKFDGQLQFHVLARGEQARIKITAKLKALAGRKSVTTRSVTLSAPTENPAKQNTNETLRRDKQTSDRSEESR